MTPPAKRRSTWQESCVNALLFLGYLVTFPVWIVAFFFFTRSLDKRSK